MIAVSLFLVVIMAGMGALLNANLLHQKSRDMRSIMDNLSFIMEDMSRNLRTGYDYRCLDAPGVITIGSPKSCASGFGIVFKPSSYNQSTNSNQWAYYIDDGKIYKSTDASTVPLSSILLTSEEVVVDQAYGFSVLGAESYSRGNRQQPLVTIRLVGKITFKNISTPFSLQTSVSQRFLDF